MTKTTNVKLPTLAQRRKQNKYYAKCGQDGYNEEYMKLQSLWMSEAIRKVDVSPKKKMTATRYIDRRRKQPGFAYALENDQLKRKSRKQKELLSNTQRTFLRPIDNFMEIQRKHTKAACVIQRGYRRYMRDQFWKRYFVKMTAATQIQRILRGVLCRKLIRQWYLQRDFLASRIQAFVRGCMTRYILRTVISWEKRNAIVLQVFFRGYLARKHTIHTIKCISAVRIQSLWRRYHDRSKVQKLFLCRQIIKIQSCYRKYVGKRAYRQMEKEYRMSTIVIQKHFRGVIAREQVRKLLLSREKQNTQDLLDVLQVEEEWRQSYIAKLARRIQRMRIEEE